MWMIDFVFIRCHDIQNLFSTFGTNCWNITRTDLLDGGRGLFAVNHSIQWSNCLFCLSNGEREREEKLKLNEKKICTREKYARALTEKIGRFFSKVRFHRYISCYKVSVFDWSLTAFLIKLSEGRNVSAWICVAGWWHSARYSSTLFINDTEPHK